VQRPSLDRILRIALKIDAGIRTQETTQSTFAPLWQHPLLLETFITMLRDDSEFHRINFEIIANLLSPLFYETAKMLCSQAKPIDSSASDDIYNAQSRVV